MKSLLRLPAFLAVALTLIATPAAFAYSTCSSVTDDSGCVISERCDFYDDETDQWVGSISIEYEC